MLKIHSTDAKQAGHIMIYIYLKVKLQSSYGSGFSVLAVRMLAKP